MQHRELEEAVTKLKRDGVLFGNLETVRRLNDTVAKEGRNRLSFSTADLDGNYVRIHARLHYTRDEYWDSTITGAQITFCRFLPITEYAYRIGNATIMFPRMLENHINEVFLSATRD